MRDGYDEDAGLDQGDDYDAFLNRLGQGGMAEQAWEQLLDDAIDEMNEKYFVAALAGRSVIASVIHDDALDRDRLVYSRPADIKLQYSHRHYKVGVSARGRDIVKDLGTAWMEHPRRRTFRQIALVPNGTCPPDVFNLWRGFGVEPKQGDRSTIRDHLLHVICSGNTIYFGWLVGWLAYCVQHPELQAEVAVVLKGKKGTGKGLVAQILMRIFRHHAIHVANSKHLVGHFNAHLADALFLFLDEALWAGDKAGEGVLKALITEKVIMIEPKGIDVFAMPNRLKILMASNSDWVVPASADERRYFVLEVSEHKRGDKEYFTRLAHAIEGEELQAFLDHLLQLDLTNWQHRSAPHTAALNEQKIIGGDSVVRFWADCLGQGTILGATDGGEGWPADIAVQVLHDAYLKHAHAHGDRHPLPINQLGRRLKQWWPDGRMRCYRPTGEVGSEARLRRYALGSLDGHRRAFLEAMSIDGASYDWDGSVS
jgi:hypothetical protein